MMRFRWGVMALVVGLVVVLSGCEGFKFIRLSEYERLRGLERLNKDQAVLITSLTHEKERLSDENASLKSMLAQGKTVAEMLEQEKNRLEEELERLRKTGGSIDLGPVGDGMETVVNSEGAGFRAGSDLLFDTGSATLKAEGKAAIDGIIPILKERTNKIRVCGYTDSQWTGRLRTYSSNFDLSAARALTVLNYLEEKGIPSDRMHLAGYGANGLIMEGGKENMKRSRRVEIILLYDWATQMSGDAAPSVAPK